MFPESVISDNNGDRIRIKLPSPLRIGLAFYPTDSLILAVDAVKDVNIESQNWDEHYGIEYDFSPSLTIRGGEEKIYMAGTDEYSYISCLGFSVRLLPGISIELGRKNDSNYLADYYGLKWEL